LGLVLEEATPGGWFSKRYGLKKKGNGAKIAKVIPGGNAAMKTGMKEGMRLLSINGVPCKHESFDHIMTNLHDLDPSTPAQLEMEVEKKETAVETLNPELMNVRVDCPPGETDKEKCNVVLEVRVTLEPSMVRSLLWKKGRTKMNKGRVMVLDSVDKKSEAFYRGLRAGMVVKALIFGAGRKGEELLDMTNMREIHMQKFQDLLRLSLHPITFVMLENVQLGPEGVRTAKDFRIARAHAKRLQIQKMNEKRMEGGRVDPLMSMLAAAVVLPPSVILALNFHFGWYTGYQ